MEHAKPGPNSVFILQNSSADDSSNMTDSSERVTKFSHILNYGTIVAAIISISCNTIAIRIITRCRKMPLSVRYLSINFLICFLVTEGIIFLHNVMMLLLGREHYEIISVSRSFFGSIAFSLMWCSLCAVAVERLIALKLLFQYKTYVTKTSLLASITALWISNFVIALLITIVGGGKMCSKYNHLSDCNVFAVNTPVRVYLGFLLVFNAMILLLVYVAILQTIRKHRNIVHVLPVNDTENQQESERTVRKQNTQSTKTIVAIILVFVILQLPQLCFAIVYIFRPNMKPHKLFQLICYISYELNTYATLYLYIWRVQECKMIFYMLLKCCKTYRKRAETMRIEILEIVTVRKTNQGTGQAIEQGK